jgi:hypothetical protein
MFRQNGLQVNVASLKITTSIDEKWNGEPVTYKIRCHVFETERLRAFKIELNIHTLSSLFFLINKTQEW